MTIGKIEQLDTVSTDVRSAVNAARIAATSASDSLLQLILTEIGGEFAAIKARTANQSILSTAGDVTADTLWLAVQAVFARYGIRIEE